MDAAAAGLYYRSYTHPDAGADKVRRVIALAWPTGLAAAGLRGDGAVVQIEWLGTTDGTPVQPGMLEQHLTAVQLLAAARLPDVLFVAGPNCLLVPEALYDRDEAATWYSMLINPMPGLQPQVQRRMPHSIAALFTKPDFLPESWMQVPCWPLAQAALSPGGQRHRARAIVLPGLVVVAAEAHNRLTHCATHDADTAEDVAWHLMQAVGHTMDEDGTPAGISLLGIDDVTAALALEAASYFPEGATDREYNDPWEPATRLFQLLAACAS